MTGLIVPLYIYPGAAWQSLIQAKQASPSVPMIAVINPASGPAATVDPNYSAGIKALQSAGIKVLGYVPTGYARKAIQAIEASIMLYLSQYPSLDGIFFDEMSSSGNEAYYLELNYFAKSKGLSLTVGNPGTEYSSTYQGIFDILIDYEAAGMISSPAKVFLAYSVPEPPSTFNYGAADWLYVTDQNLPNPYGALPPYLLGLVKSLE